MRVGLRLALPYLIALLLAGGVGEALGYSPVEAAWKARVALVGHPPVGIWQDDDKLGWRHRVGASGRESKWLAYDVRYTTDARGHRATRATTIAPSCSSWAAASRSGTVSGTKSPSQRAWPTPFPTTR